MLLHAAKYPHFAVNGLLVAEKTKEKKKDSHSEPILCVDCVPLFHGTLALAPMLEVALTLVSSCRSTCALCSGCVLLKWTQSNIIFLNIAVEVPCMFVKRNLCNICCPSLLSCLHYSCSCRQIDTWCKENNYVIVAYYQANERTKDSRYRQPHGFCHMLFQENSQL